MTRKEQIKILDDKIEANNAQYDLDRLNLNNLPKYEYLTKKDLGYKPKFEYSPIGKVFTAGLAKEDSLKKLVYLND